MEMPMRLSARLAKIWFWISSSYWFVPSIMTLGAVILAFIMVAFDQAYQPDWVSPMSWLLGGDADSARAVLQTIASSMISVAAVSFSVIFVVLTLTSSQYGPRILQLFMRERSNHLVLGTFLASFSYCLVVLKLIGHGGTDYHIPQLAVLGAFVWALLSLAMLIYFLHAVADGIQAPRVISKVGRDLRRLTSQYTSTHPDDIPDREAIIRWLDQRRSDWTHTEARDGGYVQAVDRDALIQLACEQDVTIRMRCRAGDWLFANTPIADVYGLSARDEQRCKRLRESIDECVVKGNQRTPIDDIEFAVLQLVEIAVRALSPGINDPYTAVNCIDELGEALGRIAAAPAPAFAAVKDDGTPIVVFHPPDFEHIVATAFNDIREAGHGHMAVVRRMLQTMEAVIIRCRSRHRQEVVLAQMERLTRGALEQIHDLRDREEIGRRAQDVREAARRHVAPDAAPTT